MSTRTPVRRTSRPRRRVSARVRRRRLAFGTVAVLLSMGVAWLWVSVMSEWVRDLGPAIETGPDSIASITQPEAVTWSGKQPTRGVDVSFPQCGRTLRDLEFGYVIVGLDGGMPNRPNPCFAAQWAFAEGQAGAAVYVNTADSGRSDPADVGRRAGTGDVEALADNGIEPGTPVWLDVELPEVWNGSRARHRAVISEHLRVLAEAGYPVGIYSAPALWEEITGNATLDVPTWVGIGEASAEQAAGTCERTSFGGRRPAIVQRIGEGSDGRPLDRNLTCPDTDLTGLVRPG